MSEFNREYLLKILENRFSRHMYRHPNLTWQEVLVKLESNEKILEIIFNMEETGGEPDLVTRFKEENPFIYVDCSKESPSGRRSLCYDRRAWEERKEYKPQGTAMNLARELGITMIDEAEYRKLQTIEPFDLKTSSWVVTPTRIRDLGGAIFCDRRYDTVFTYHNGADSYYAARGFRGYISL